MIVIVYVAREISYCFIQSMIYLNVLNTCFELMIYEMILLSYDTQVCILWTWTYDGEEGGVSYPKHLNSFQMVIIRATSAQISAVAACTTLCVRHYM